MPPRPDEPLRLLSIGGGAIGTYIGGSLALAGYPVVFLERPAVAAELAVSGLHLKIGGRQEQIAQPHLAASLAEALARGPYDAALFALKSFDTAAALDELVSLANQVPPIVCLQNGVENEALIGQVLGPDKVISATVTSAIGRLGPGDIILERLRGIGLADGHPLSERLEQAMNAAGLNARRYPRPAEMKWSKLLTNLLANSSSAILDLTPAEVFAHPGLYRLEVAQLREALRVMAAQGLAPVNLPGTPVRLLAFAIRRLPLALAKPFLQRAVGGARGAKMPSFHIDLHAGQSRIEVDYLNGAVVRFGQRLGIPTPVNNLLNTTLLNLAAGNLPFDTYAKNPDLLLHELKT